MTANNNPIPHLKFFTISFIFLGIADIICNVSQLPVHFSRLAAIGHFIKPALMPCLAIWVWLDWQQKPTAAFRLLFAALLFSALGDTLLMLANTNSKSLFLGGLSAFLIAHILYIALHSRLSFSRPIHTWFIMQNKWIFIIALLYGSLLLYLLSPFLLNTGLLLPVTVYALVLLTMALSALNRKGQVSAASFCWVFAGATSFVLSDSLIAISRFGTPFYTIGFWIMITYLFAQYGIVRGLLMSDKI